MISYLQQFVNSLQRRATKLYLILANVILVIFTIWFGNVGLLPFAKTGDFLFFVALALILALYRPGWTFVLFIGALALENINLAPKSFGLAIRPYQFFGAITILALVVQISMKRLPFALPKWKWYDALPIVFAVGSFLSSLGAVNKGMSFKQSIVAATFVALYFLTRVYIQSWDDLKRVAPFFLSSAIVVVIYGIWQNVRFLHGGNPFEIMLGRPNATFTEADWFGIYLVFLLAVIFTIIYMVSIERNKKQETITKQITNYNVQNYKWFGCLKFGDCILFVSCILYLVLLFVALILTVSRSAWIGAVIVMLVFLKCVLIGHYAESVSGRQNRWQRFIFLFKLSRWQWREAGKQLLFILIALGISLLISLKVPLTNFQLANRAVSTGGLQKITIACSSVISPPDVPQLENGAVIKDMKDLDQYACRHINLEDMDKEIAAGYKVTEIYRPDPNVNVRSEIYRKSIEQIRQHPIFGIGWGNISAILGTDERGAGLNASDIFLEVWLGAGLLGFLSFVILLLYILIKGIITFLDKGVENKTLAVFVFLGWAAIVFPNLFNSGIFLGFVWVYLGIAVSLLAEKKR